VEVVSSSKLLSKARLGVSSLDYFLSDREFVTEDLVKKATSKLFDEDPSETETDGKPKPAQAGSKSGLSSQAQKTLKPTKRYSILCILENPRCHEVTGFYEEHSIPNRTCLLGYAIAVPKVRAQQDSHAIPFGLCGVANFAICKRWPKSIVSSSVLSVHEVTYGILFTSVPQRKQPGSYYSTRKISVFALSSAICKTSITIAASFAARIMTDGVSAHLLIDAVGTTQSLPSQVTWRHHFSRCMVAPEGKSHFYLSLLTDQLLWFSLPSLYNQLAPNAK
jgi:hypothetical protein